MLRQLWKLPAAQAVSVRPCEVGQLRHPAGAGRLRGLGRCAPCRPCLHENYPLRGPFSPAPACGPTRGAPTGLRPPRSGHFVGGQAAFGTRPAGLGSKTSKLVLARALRFRQKLLARPLAGPGARASPPTIFSAAVGLLPPHRGRKIVGSPTRLPPGPWAFGPPQTGSPAA